jgi:hypothetical protein
MARALEATIRYKAREKEGNTAKLTMVKTEGRDE